MIKGKLPFKFELCPDMDFLLTMLMLPESLLTHFPLD